MLLYTQRVENFGDSLCGGDKCELLDAWQEAKFYNQEAQ
jgi:hypothetical protein